MAGITACREVDNNPTVNASRVQKCLEEQRIKSTIKLNKLQLSLNLGIKGNISRTSYSESN